MLDKWKNNKSQQRDRSYKENQMENLKLKTTRAQSVNLSIEHEKLPRLNSREKNTEKIKNLGISETRTKDSTTGSLESQ